MSDDFKKVSAPGWDDEVPSTTSDGTDPLPDRKRTSIHEICAENTRLTAENEELRSEAASKGLLEEDYRQAKARIAELESWNNDAYTYLCVLLDHVSGETEIPTEEWFVVDAAQEFIETGSAALKGEQK